MKFVRLENNTVREIIPGAAAPDIAHWYGAAFAALCREAPDEVEQHWVFDPETDAWSEPPEQEYPGTEPEDPSAAARNNLIWLLVQGEIAENLTADQIITNETAFEEWGEERA